MCLAIPGKIKKKQGNYANVDFDGIIKKINIQLTPEVKAGDYVLAHTGFAIQKLTHEDAFDALKIYEKFSKNK